MDNISQDDSQNVKRIENVGSERILGSSAKYYLKHLGEEEYNRCSHDFRLFLGIPGESHKLYFGTPRDYFEGLTKDIAKIVHTAVYPVIDPTFQMLTLTIQMKLETGKFAGHLIDYNEYSATPEELRGLIRFAGISKISELEGKCIEVYTEKHYVALGICIDKSLLGMPVRQSSKYKSASKHL